MQKAPHARTLPPCLLEWRSVKQKSNAALNLTLPDKAISTVNVDSWTTCEEVSSTYVVLYQFKHIIFFEITLAEIVSNLEKTTCYVTIFKE